LATRLYLISPEKIDHPAIFAEEVRAAFDGGDVAAFQLRLKDVDDATIARVADTLRPICQQRDVAFIDMSCAEARRIVGPDRQIGVTCKSSRHLAMEAAEAGADYVAFGAFFPSSTKSVTTPADLDVVRWWSELFEIPCVAIGGITVDNCKPVIDAGADFLAVGSGVWNHGDGPKEAVRAFNGLLARPDP
jgi:thiamine-phosphate pyrophosphorylase